MTHQQVAKYESGKNIPCSYRLTQIADFYKVKTDDLINPDFIHCQSKTPQDAGYLKPQEDIGSLEEIKKAENEQAKQRLIRRSLGNLSFDASKYEEFEDEYPAPLSQLEHDPKMRATYDAILEGRKR